jgi:hypothetical protein
LHKPAEPASCTLGEEADPDSPRIIDAWPEVPAHMEAAVLALVKAAGR